MYYDDEVYFLRKQIVLLIEENKELRKQAYDASELAFQSAITSDKMKFDLIMSGCLIKPKA